MKSRVVQVVASSRLHFGMISPSGDGRTFGGAGVMVDRPGLQLRLERADELQISGPLADRVGWFVKRWEEFHHWPDGASCRIGVSAAPPAHVGLGLGTQLGMSVAAGLGAMHGLPAGSVKRLARSVGRGMRSAVGAHGFMLGGFIVEQGKLPAEEIAPLDERLPMPDRWRFLLVRPSAGHGLHGAGERRAFQQLPPTPEATREKLAAELRDAMLPAIAAADFDAFSNSLYRYGRQAGMCFAQQQGGPFNGPVLTQLVQDLRNLGVEGVGQSSWGPTIFAASPDEECALRLRDALLDSRRAGEIEAIVAAPANEGAMIGHFPASVRAVSPLTGDV